jgi:hypothetical protein
VPDLHPTSPQEKIMRQKDMTDFPINRDMGLSISESILDLQQFCLECAGRLPVFPFPPFSCLIGLDQTGKREKGK